MYGIYEERKDLSYYTAKSWHRVVPDKRENLFLKVYDNLVQPYFDDMSSGNKSIVYDHVFSVLKEFGLTNVSDEILWNITVICRKGLEKNYNGFVQIVLDRTFEEIEKYFKKEGITHGRIRELSEPSSSQSKVQKLYID